VATGLPVLAFGALIAVGARQVALAYDRMAAFERVARVVTGVVFIVVGVYYTLTQIFGMRHCEGKMKTLSASLFICTNGRMKCTRESAKSC